MLTGKFRGESLRSLVARLHRDERGAEGVEKLLLIAAIVLPLLGVLIIFRDDITKWVEEKWTDIKGRGAEPTVNP
jgi:Flp pilus assembly pilin Flp